MLEVIMDKHILYILMGIFAVLGVVSKCVANITLKRLVKAAGNMNKSTHSLMRLVRAKFEHACMISDKVQNVEVFVEKYLYEYKVIGLKLHSWRRMEKGTAWLCGIAGLLAALGEYILYGMNDQVLKNGAAGIGLAVLLFLFHITTDENYQIEAAKTYMVDYLENVCAHRYEKTVQKEIKVMAPPEAPVPDVNEPSQKTGYVGDPQQNKPAVDAPGYPRPREEVPSPAQSPEITPPVMPEPNHVPETAGIARMTESSAREETAVLQNDGLESKINAVQEELISPEINIVPDAVLMGDANGMSAAAKMTAAMEAEEEKQVEKPASRAVKRAQARRNAEKKAEAAVKPEPDERKQLPKEVLIREILEEFLA